MRSSFLHKSLLWELVIRVITSEHLRYISDSWVTPGNIKWLNIGLYFPLFCHHSLCLYLNSSLYINNPNIINLAAS